jgi:hypothetical protein
MATLLRKRQPCSRFDTYSNLTLSQILDQEFRAIQLKSFGRPASVDLTPHGSVAHWGQLPGTVRLDHKPLDSTVPRLVTGSRRARPILGYP